MQHQEEGAWSAAGRGSEGTLSSNDYGSLSLSNETARPGPPWASASETPLRGGSLRGCGLQHQEEGARGWQEAPPARKGGGGGKQGQVLQIQCASGAGLQHQEGAWWAGGRRHHQQGREEAGAGAADPVCVWCRLATLRRCVVGRRRHHQPRKGGGEGEGGKQGQVLQIQSASGAGGLPQRGLPPPCWGSLQEGRKEGGEGWAGGGPPPARKGEEAVWRAQIQYYICFRLDATQAD